MGKVGQAFRLLSVKTATGILRPFHLGGSDESETNGGLISVSFFYKDFFIGQLKFSQLLCALQISSIRSLGKSFKLSFSVKHG